MLSPRSRSLDRQRTDVPPVSGLSTRLRIHGEGCKKTNHVLTVSGIWLQLQNITRRQGCTWSHAPLKGSLLGTYSLTRSLIHSPTCLLVHLLACLHLAPSTCTLNYSLTCFLSCLRTCFPAPLLACSLAYLVASLYACFLACLLACLLACVLTYIVVMHSCLLTCLPAGSPSRLITRSLSSCLLG